MSSQEVTSVSAYTRILKDLLHKGRSKKPTGAIDPILRLEDLGSNASDIRSQLQAKGNKSYAAIETACRNIFYDLLVGAPEF